MPVVNDIVRKYGGYSAAAYWRLQSINPNVTGTYSKNCRIVYICSSAGDMKQAGKIEEWRLNDLYAVTIEDAANAFVLEARLAQNVLTALGCPTWVKDHINSTY